MTISATQQGFSHEEVVRSHIDEVVRLEPLLSQIAAAAGLPEERQPLFIVVITEALSNAILHGNKQDPRKLVRLRFYTRPDPPTLIAEVEDEGMGFDPTKIPDPTVEGNLMQESGRGVFLMRNLADEVIFKKGGAMCGAALSAVIGFSYEAQLRPWRLRAARLHRTWLLHCLSVHDPGRCVRRVQYYFVSEPTIAYLHGQYLGEATPTDILTFGYPLAEGVEAEIYIAPRVVRRNSQAYGTAPGEELRRVLVHGLLHLLGWEDQSEAQAQAMRAAEEACLRLWRELFPPKLVSHETLGS